MPSSAHASARSAAALDGSFHARSYRRQASIGSMSTLLARPSYALYRFRRGAKRSESPAVSCGSDDHANPSHALIAELERQAARPTSSRHRAMSAHGPYFTTKFVLVGSGATQVLVAT